MLDVENNLEEIIKPGRDCIDYYKDYNQLVEQCLVRGLNKSNVPFYTEKHHIYPKCLGGGNVDSNYVLFSPLEHITAHILLYRSYPDNLKLLRACSAEIYMTKGDAESLFKIEKVRELAAKREIFGTPVVCHDQDFNVVRVYRSTNLCEEDGFCSSTVSYVILGVYSTSGGYYWSELEDFEEEHSDKLEYFYSLDKKDWPEIIKKERLDPSTFNKIELSYKKTNKAIVQADEHNNIIKIYRTRDELALENFLRKYVEIAIEIKGKYEGFRWYTLDYFSTKYPKKLTEFNQKTDTDLNKFTKTRSSYVNSKDDSDFIICYDKDYKIFRMYGALYEVLLDDFTEGGVSCALNLGNRTNNTNFYKGYYWTKLSKWTDKEKLKEYELLEIEGNLPELKVKSFKTKIVRCKDLDGTIETIYSSIGQVRESGIHHQNLFRKLRVDSAKNKHSLYNGSYWYKYDEFKSLFPEKLKDFEDKNKTLNL